MCHPCCRPKKERKKGIESIKGRVGERMHQRAYVPVLGGDETLIFGFDFRIDLGAPVKS
jgi:hypothetical protein